MGDHLALLVNRLLTESTLHAAIESRNKAKEMDDDGEFESLSRNIDVEDLSFKKLVECRICQDEDFDSKMEIPCSCRGSLKYAHRRCVQRWCNEKGDTVCEICHQPFRPGYHAPPPVLFRHIPVNVRRNWEISRRELHRQQYIETISVDEESLISSDTDHHQLFSRTYMFRFVVYIIFLGLLVLRHILPFFVGNDEFVLPLFLLAALRIAGILLLVYVTMKAVTGLRRHRHQEEIENSESDASDTSSDNETEQDQHPPPHSHVIQMS